MSLDRFDYELRITKIEQIESMHTFLFVFW